MGWTEKSFTLIEIMLVVIITGILSAIGLVNYNKSIKWAADGEAKASLSLIQVAQRSYIMEYPSFYDSSGNIDNTTDAPRKKINSVLKLDLPLAETTANPPKWKITIYSSGYAEATRAGRTWRINFSKTGGYQTPTCTSGC